MLLVTGGASSEPDDALRAASEVLIPVETSFFSLKGAGKQVGTIRTLARRLGGATPHRLLATMHDPDSPLARKLLNDLDDRFSDHLVPVVIRHDIKLREATSLGRLIVEHAPAATGAEDYGKLASWLMDNPPGRHAIAAALAAEDDEPADAAPPSNSPVEVMAPAARRTLDAHAPHREDSSADAMMTRAAEMAARVRQLMHRSDSLQAKLGGDERVIEATNRPAVSPESSEAWRPGPNFVPGGVRFVYPGAPGQNVCIAGDFNGWSSTATPMRYDAARSCYTSLVPLPAGRRLYRLVVNGLWKADPNNPEVEENPFGDRNSIVVVRPASPHAIATPA